MDRKAMAQETLTILQRGSYEPVPKRRIDLKEDLERSVRHSILITPEDGVRLLAEYGVCTGGGQLKTRVDNAVP